jgi:hypothetical protein
VVQKSDLHKEYIPPALMQHLEYVLWSQVLQCAEENFMQIECVGVNPYKLIEMFTNYGLVVPAIESYYMDKMYAKPSPEVMSKMKSEKLDRLEFKSNPKKEKDD